ncbi:UDP-N-acetylmuramoyl-tripeptide--D-alanyl-D-alanine ligase [Carnobacterium maltaromaticum]|uniref:UDP-N-acetylmuramoyl-tripeptide--D-alanyl-D- alanine ligase n=1 Tax=Carnobacterium maltaromaticum TaxID=2751 RepID=UPI001DFD09B7|nr:UDP-N-acetylmuramoyl-tripeptide--D-alanyl-D-alanine ligase [Carnobacterium maltaromaticum]MCC4313571.1 UDP-N-acetylmuramoyl-tripeptide--D-alanyl-D-alanine ligase [Carnobacterium maltaromaticum]
MDVLSLKEIALAVGATNDLSDWTTIEVDKVEFDSRKLEKGSLFVPLKGDNDGHDYIQSAIEKGASAAFWSEAIEKAPVGFPVLVVEDTLKALQDLAKYYLKVVNPKVVGITGSNGKTTTKDMTEAVIRSKFKVHKTQGNFNNHIGLPMTILEMPSSTEVIILEMGMNHAGEIKVLSELAEPDVAVITMIGESHIEYLGSRKGIAAAKMEIVAGLKKNGTLIYPGEEELLSPLVQELEPKQRITFGTGKTNNMYPVTIEPGMYQTKFTTNVAPEIECSIPVLGTYNVTNAMAALMVGFTLGISVEVASPELAKFNLTKNRTEWLAGINDSMILNDAYNANPTAMKAVLDNFSELMNEGRKIAVLGDMLELGETSRELHASVVGHIQSTKIDEVFLFGHEMAVLYEALKETYPVEQLHYFEDDKLTLITSLKKSIKRDDFVLVKSSLGTDLLAVVVELTK